MPQSQTVENSSLSLSQPKPIKHKNVNISQTITSGSFIFFYISDTNVKEKNPTGKKVIKTFEP
jgi:hypothetical protein